MIAPLIAMQTNAIQTMNMAQAGMVSNAVAISFGTSQPLKPAFAQSADVFELQNKANETKMSVAQRLLQAIEEALGKNIAKSTPKYGGLDYKA